MKKVNFTLTKLQGDEVENRSEAVPIQVGPVDKIARVRAEGEVAEPKFQYTLGGEEESWFPYLKEWKGLYDPIKNRRNWPSILIMGTLSTFFFLLSDMIGKGWRLRVTKQVGLGLTPMVPQFSILNIGETISTILGILKHGFVLTIMRQLYFFPLYIASLLSGGTLIKLLWELIWQWWEGKQEGILQNFLLNILPQFATDLIIEIFVLALYVVLVWPVYRILFIRYAIGDIRGRGFLSIRRIGQAISTYRRNASEILGIYSFTLTLDVALIITVIPLVVGSGGLLGLLAPTALLLTRFWIKGYAYGILLKKLIKSGEFTPSIQGKEAVNSTPVL